jgi:hypothetical protein
MEGRRCSRCPDGCVDGSAQRTVEWSTRAPFMRTWLAALAKQWSYQRNRIAAAQTAPTPSFGELILLDILQRWQYY